MKSSLIWRRKHSSARPGTTVRLLSICRQIGQQSEFPPNLFMDFEKILDLRYGENPHQRAAFYKWGGQPCSGWPRQSSFKEKSFPTTTSSMLKRPGTFQEFDSPACCIIKHTNPCGAAIGSSLREAYVKAYEADPVSAFGSIIAMNQKVDAETANELVNVQNCSSKRSLRPAMTPRRCPFCRQRRICDSCRWNFWRQAQAGLSSK